MTALRPERESGTAYGQSSGDSYGGAGDQGTPYGQQPYGDSGAHGDWYGGGAAPAPAQGGYGADGYGSERYGAQTYGTDAYQEPYAQQTQPSRPEHAQPQQTYIPPPDDETVALRIADTAAAVGARSGGRSAESPDESPVGGRAARRKAAKRRHGRRGTGRPDPENTETEPDAPTAPRSRLEARRQARARKPSAATLASRAIGEVFITTGVLMLLFVSYQLWWTNVRAHAQADKEASSLQDDWASGKRNPGSFEPGQGFALLHIPKLDVVVPIAEGISNKQVLDRGMVGHYGEGKLKTAMPDARTGNFGLAGHRNTHGEPFRYINRLTPGDDIVVETQDKFFVYKMASVLPVTSPSNVSVLEPVPRGSGFTKPGRYITLTTCTPEFTSKYRLIVWGKMVEERPRSKGKPDALVS
ncbi:class E sortase [Streptomyces sp. KAU_LT]|uniref:class E sortase n=1 Tax=Streptomyces sp. KAU_LT TaxID=3046669 RepID=UPI0024B743A9|nr:class E sortase [Streptomyces sp. KAU_LT]MDI9832329.1 class E sortase [Streptomyces sp. KAU_LT]